LIIEKWEQIQRILNTDVLDHLIETLIKETGAAPYMDGGFKKKQAGLYSAIMRAGGAKDRNFRDWCLKALREVDEKIWRDEFAQEGNLLELVIDILDSGYKVGLGTQFQDALTEYSYSVIKGQNEPERLREYWRFLPNALKEAYARKTFRRRLVAAAVERKGELSPVFFDLYGTEMSDAEILSETSGIVLNMFTPLLDERHPQGLEWMADTLELHKSLLANCGPHDVIEDFHDRVLFAIKNDPGDQASPHILRISQLLGIQPDTLAENG
jgi:hypothetical protein